MGLTPQQQRILDHLGAYELGEGWAEPEEEGACLWLADLDYLRRSGTGWRLTEKGRAHADPSRLGARLDHADGGSNSR